MLIANPLYDVVFKFLMEDLESARLLLGAILGEEILELQFRPTEAIAPKMGEESEFEFKKPIYGLRPYFLDFSAKIKTPYGTKLTLLEVQKVKIPTDSFRFRGYLGRQYADPGNFYFDEDENGNPIKRPIPIINIYFLGYDLENIIDVPVIKIERLYWDAYSGEPIAQHDPFIECLTHDCLVVCIKALKDKRRNELEALLSVFDQSQAGEDAHFLELKQGEIPNKYLPIMQRLHMATHEPELMEQMLYEDMLISEMEDYIRMQVEHERAQKDEALKKADEYFHLAQQSKSEKVALEQEKEEWGKEKEELGKEKEELSKEKEELSKEKEELSKKNEELSKEQEESSKRFSTIARVLFNEGKGLETISLMMNLSVDSVKDMLDQGE
jgi:hypothetical protein